ncbi:short-chain dehydrogenase/reductase SDR [Rubrobacter xylanophilus DSM 9941]|uniref:Short-chain dehydrogenase/reductase SDR n=1 Tax=Rubrobacter xylanophilus (strain DSM 9941 / JCM 11954 / NBRC 16129 / PRD-1) TaxID=266117 RepID=Q1AV92_RUBXD|nr:SDR family oxidoreductase [Rubrobacter xylanophilus]ABG04686.1 short-chain dehydrogenase/reductase SDR [Rubrobacter xylanophilus DSM 9941]
MATNGDPRRFDGKVAVVTGGTQGLGESVALQLAERGAAGIVITGRNEERGRRVAAVLRKLGAEPLFVAANLADVDAPFRIIEAVDEAFGRVDVLANCAANPERDTIWDSTPEFFDRMFAVNVRAPYFLIQGAARIMRRENIQGTIVNVISISSHGGQPYISSYCASKGALATMTRNVAHALLPYRIRVNGLNPGWMATPGENETQRRFHGAREGWIEEAGKTRPFGRLILPEEAARAVLFLASGESGLMTGAVVDYDQQVIGAYD